MRNRLWMAWLTSAVIGFGGLTTHAKPKPVVEDSAQSTGQNENYDEKPVKKSIAKAPKEDEDDDGDEKAPAKKTSPSKSETANAGVKKTSAKTEKDSKPAKVVKASDEVAAPASSSDKKVAVILKQIEDVKGQLDQLEKEVKALGAAAPAKSMTEAKPSVKSKKQADEDSSESAPVKAAAPKAKKKDD